MTCAGLEETFARVIASERLLGQALAIEPGFADAQLDRATLLMNKPNVVEAESCFKRASLMRPGDANVGGSHPSRPSEVERHRELARALLGRDRQGAARMA